VKILKNQSGIAGVAVVLIVAILLVVGLVAYNNSQIKEVSTDVSVPDAPTISSVADLDKATQVLGEINPEDSDADTPLLDDHLATF